MSSEPRRQRELPPAYARAKERTAEVGDRARAASGLQDGVAPKPEHPVEASVYEKFLTGEQTVIPKPAPLRVNTPKIILLGTMLWAVALVVTLLVPNLHTGERDWWPYACVAGIVLGLIGWAYVRRGRGNAEAA